MVLLSKEETVSVESRSSIPTSTFTADDPVILNLNNNVTKISTHNFLRGEQKFDGCVTKLLLSLIAIVLLSLYVDTATVDVSLPSRKCLTEGVTCNHDELSMKNRAGTCVTTTSLQTCTDDAESEIIQLMTVPVSIPLDFFTVSGNQADITGEGEGGGDCINQFEGTSNEWEDGSHGSAAAVESVDGSSSSHEVDQIQDVAPQHELTESINNWNLKVEDQDKAEDKPTVRQRLRLIYRCDKCNKTFASSVNLELHKKSHSLEEERFGSNPSPEAIGDDIDEDDAHTTENEERSEEDRSSFLTEEDSEDVKLELELESEHFERANRNNIRSKRKLKLNMNAMSALKLKKRLPGDWLELKLPDSNLTLDNFLSVNVALLDCDLDTCNYGFTSASELAKHSKLHGEFICNFCGVLQSLAYQFMRGLA